MKKGSETKTIKRSEINLNPYNPKHHSDEEIKQQKANIKRVGLLGGLVWNEATGNLLDGHRRISAMDAIRKYDGTPETDYDIKVEAVDFDEKTEKEQMTYMAVANTKVDYNEVAKYIDDIDFKAAGFTEEDAAQIKQLQDDLEETLQSAEIPDLGDDFLRAPQPQAEVAPVMELGERESSIEEIQKRLDEKPKMTAEEVKGQKQHCDEVATNHITDMDTYVFLEFDSIEQKLIFCELLGLEPGLSMKVKGTDVLNHIE